MPPVIVATIGIVGVSPVIACLFFLPAEPLSATRGLFGSLQEKVLMGFALLWASAWALCRRQPAMIGRLAPQGMTGEFYACLAALRPRPAWMAPRRSASSPRATQSNRLGCGVRAVFLVLRLFMLWRVREERAAIRGGGVP